MSLVRWDLIFIKAGVIIGNKIADFIMGGIGHILVTLEGYQSLKPYWLEIQHNTITYYWAKQG